MSERRSCPKGPCTLGDLTDKQSFWAVRSAMNGINQDDVLTSGGRTVGKLLQLGGQE